MAKEFTMGNMHDMGKMMDDGLPKVSTIKRGKKKYYPMVSTDEKHLPELKGLSLGDALTLHAHARIKGMMKQNNDPGQYDIEIEKMGMKMGHNPFKSKRQMRKFFAMEARGELAKGTARRWAHETSNIKSLPERKSSGKASKDYDLGAALLSQKKKRKRR